MSVELSGRARGTVKSPVSGWAPNLRWIPQSWVMGFVHSFWEHDGVADILLTESRRPVAVFGGM